MEINGFGADETSAGGGRNRRSDMMRRGGDVATVSSINMASANWLIQILIVYFTVLIVRYFSVFLCFLNIIAVLEGGGGGGGGLQASSLFIAV